MKKPFDSCGDCKPIHQIEYRNKVTLCGALSLNNKDTPLHDVIKLCVYNPNNSSEVHESRFHIEEACNVAAMLSELVGTYLEEFDLKELHRIRSKKE